MPRITGKDAEGLLAAYAKVHAPKNEIVEEQPTQEGDVEELKEEEQLNELGGLGTGGLMKQTAQQPQQKPQSFGQRQIAKAKMRGNPAAQAQDRMSRGTPVNQLFNKGGPQQQQQQQQKPGLGSRIKSGLAGGLRGLGNLAGKAVGGLKRVAGGVADKLTGDRFDFDKRGPSGGQQQGAGGKAQGGGVQPTRQQVQTARADTTSPAAKAGISADMRAQAAAKHADFQAKRASQSPTDRRNERLAAIKNRGRPLARLNNEYDSMADVYDDTVNFLVSEGYTEEQSLAIMAEPMFIEAFNEGFLEVLNEQKEV